MKTKRNLIIVLIAVLAIAASSMTAWAAKPEKPDKPVKGPVLDSTLCAELSGTWNTSTCTIDENTEATASSGFTIPGEVTLVINGVLNVGAFDNPDDSELDPQKVSEFSIDNSGTIAVHNNLINLRTINNSGTITVDSNDIRDMNFGIANGGVITNSGTIIVENSTQQVGIFNFGDKIPPDEDDGDTDFYFNAVLTNEETGAIVINNSGPGSTGLENHGSVSNFGTITVNDLSCLDGGYSYPVGIYNVGLFTNEVSGTLDNDFGTYVYEDYNEYETRIGIRNAGGTMVNYGTANNDGAMVTSGFIMLTYGTINNRGSLIQKGGELVNYGTVHNYGEIGIEGSSNYPHNRGTCIDEGIWDEGGNLIDVGTGCN